MAMSEFKGDRPPGPFLWDEEFFLHQDKKEIPGVKLGGRTINLVEPTIHGPDISKVCHENGKVKIIADFSGLLNDPITKELINSYRKTISQIQESGRSNTTLVNSEEQFKNVQEKKDEESPTIILDSYSESKEAKMKTKLVPVYREESKDFFITHPAYATLPEVEVVKGQKIETGFLRIGTVFYLLGISQTEALLKTNIMDLTDELDPSISISSILLEDRTRRLCKVIRFTPNQVSPGFDYAIQGNHRILKLDYGNVEFGFHLSGYINLETSSIEMSTSSPSPNAEWIPIGYKLNAYRTNSKRAADTQASLANNMCEMTCRGYRDSGELVIRRSNGLVVKDIGDNTNRGHYYTLEHDQTLISSLLFQNGSVPENGITGWRNEEIIEILAHRLEVLNQQFPCFENVIAGRHLIAALNALEARTRNRQARGVEGKNKV